MLVHVRKHQRPQFACDQCQKFFTSDFNLRKHQRVHHEIASSPKQRRVSKSIKPSHSKPVLNVFTSVFFRPQEEDVYDVNRFQQAVQSEVHSLILDLIHSQGPHKWYLVLKVQFEKTSVDGEEESIDAYFKSHMYTQLSAENLKENYETAFSKILKSIKEYIKKGSGWRLSKIHHLENCIAKYHPLHGSSYIPLPEKWVKKKAILNVQNFEDTKCLVWCLLAHKMNLHWNVKPERVTHYQSHEKEILMGNVENPVCWRKIPIIENLNQLRINLFILESDEV